MEELTQSDQMIISKILIVDGCQVMLDSDLAELYEVPTKRLNEQVKRNAARFPPDFMFQLNPRQWDDLRSQFATSSWGGRRTMPYVFTEQGVAMLSSVLNSSIAIQVNIEIIRVFTKLRRMVLTHQEVLIKINEVEKRLGDQDEKIATVFDYLRQFIRDQEKPRQAIGYRR